LGERAGSVDGFSPWEGAESVASGEQAMENALLVGLSRQTALQRELDIVANNIANLNTTGFKADGAVFSEFLPPGASLDQFAAPDRRLSFVQDRMSWHDMSQGTVQTTGNPLDVAIDGDGMLVVQTARGERYTRNGALQISNTGELVTSSGDKVLGENGPIVFQLTDRDIVINKDGTIKVREGISLNSDSTRGKLRLVTFENPQQLRKDGASTFMAPDGVTPQPLPDARAHVMQGALEKSNVRSVIEMTRMIELTRAYTEVATMLQQQNDLRKNSIQQLAEVPA
jgi:flagellar basal-body rod protein FlgF